MKPERFSPSFIGPLFAMLKRPLHPQFSDAVREGRKVTTIRDKSWPCWKPIMLYNWSGAAYRSKQIDVCQVVVEESEEVTLTRNSLGNIIVTPCVPRLCGNRQLWECEGFESFDAFCDWFRPLIKPRETITKTLMRFRLANAGGQAIRTGSATLQNLNPHNLP
jgi:hypothetical protein